MPISSNDLTKIEEHMRPLIGQPVWGVKLGVGSFLTLEFGDRRTTLTGDQEATHGEWHLWIYCSAWRMDTEQDLVIASEDPREVLEASVSNLNGHKLVSITVIGPALELTLEFENKTTLRVFPVFSTEYEHWFLYTPDSNVLTAGPGASWSYGQGRRSAG